MRTFKLPTPAFHLQASTIAALLLSLVLPLHVDAQDVPDHAKLRIGVFQGAGVGSSVDNVLEALEQVAGEANVRRITAEQIQSDGLDDFDVLVHPGGSGSGQGKALGERGRRKVREFVQRGGGYLGICAGSYLATNDYSWSLRLLDAKVVDRRHWARGNGTVEITLSPAGMKFFGQARSDMEIHYGQGPLLGRREWDDPQVPDYQSLAVYKTEIADNDAPAGVMPGTSAVVRTRYGSGRVFCFSPHPELTPGRQAMISDAVRWLSGVSDEHAVEIPSISEIVRRHVPQDSSGGVAVLVTQNGNVLHRMGYGFVNGRHLTTQTPLSLASVTKQFAAMCAAMLIEEGRLDLDEKVSHYLPDLNLPVDGRELRVKDLLWHTSGLPNFINAKEKAAIAEFKKQHGLDYLDNATHAQWLATMKMRRAPGEQFEYTNSGYVLLARIIEVITCESFHDFQKRRILDVLQMQDTTDSTRFNGSGNMKTTLLDYTKWDRALWQLDARLLSKPGYEQLFRQGKLDSEVPVDYGFGWRLNYRDRELLTAEHGGVGSGTTAARNLVRRHFNDGVTVAIFAQEHPQLGLDDRAALVSEIYEWLRRNRPVFQTAGAAFASRMEALLAATQETSYQHKTSIDEAQGTVHCDCSGLIGYVLRREFPDAYAALAGEEAAWRVRPLAVTFYETFQSAATSSAPGEWQPIESLMDVVAGDVIAWRKPTVERGSSTGHVLMVAGPPQEIGGGLVRLRTIDSTRNSMRQGFGEGYRTFTIDETGQPTGYLVGERRQAALIAIGRLNEPSPGL